AVDLDDGVRGVLLDDREQVAEQPPLALGQLAASHRLGAATPLHEVDGNALGRGHLPMRGLAAAAVATAPRAAVGTARRRVLRLLRGPVLARPGAPVRPPLLAGHRRPPPARRLAVGPSRGSP